MRQQRRKPTPGAAGTRILPAELLYEFGVLADDAISLLYLALTRGDPGDAYWSTKGRPGIVIAMPHYEAAAKQARKFRDEGAHFSASATVLAEVHIGNVRRGPESAWQRESRFINAFGRPIAIDEDVAVAAAKLRAQHKALRLSDALVIAVGRADVVLTADKRWAQVDQHVRVIG